MLSLVCQLAVCSLQYAKYGVKMYYKAHGIMDTRSVERLRWLMEEVIWKSWLVLSGLEELGIDQNNKNLAYV